MRSLLNISLVCTLAVVSVSVSPLAAQQGRGAMFGTVTDPTGAGVPNAQVTITQLNTNQVFPTRSGADGVFSSPTLPVGSYRVQVEASGFKRSVRSDIELNVDQRAQVDFVLEVGSMAESIEVTSAAPLVDTGSATVGKVIENKRIQELPINGRNALALVLLTPGVKSQAGGNASGFADRGIALSAISINGGPNSLNSFVLDGGNNNQGYLADVNANPTVDAIQEFKVQSAVMSAEYGFTAGGVVNVVTKSGSNDFHGTLYEFFRNDALDARPTFSATKPPFRYNQYGGALGGPVWIPKIYNGRNRTFFFYNYEEWKYVRTTNPITSTPIDSWRRGDFSNFLDANGRVVPIYDPFSTAPNPNGSGAIRTAFPGNIIPTNRLDSAAVALLRFFPQPNRTPSNAFTQANNYLSTVKENREMQQHTLKVDHHFGDSNSFFARYLQYHHYTDGSNNAATPWPDPAARARYDNLYSKNIVLSDTHTFSPTILNELRVGVARSYFPFTAASFGQNLPRTLGLPASIPSDTLPNISGTGFAAFGAMTVGIRGSTTWQITDMATWVKGSHTLKLGYEHRLNQANNYQRENPSHAFTFSSALTNNPQSTAGTGASFASFLLGAVSNSTAYQYLGEAEKGYSASAFAQDDWRATRRLTLNLGVRWDYQQWPRERWNGTSNFDPTGVIPGTDLRGKTIYAGIDYGSSPFEPIYTNFAPRVGLAYDLSGKGTSVFRAGYSIFYPSTFYRDTFGNTQGFANTTTAYNPPGNDTNYPAFRFQDGFPTPPIQPLGAKLGPAAFLGQSVSYDQSQERVPMSQQWTASLQHQVKGWLVDVGYSGNHATHLAAGSYSLNEISPDQYSLGTALQSSVPNPYAGRVPGALGGATIARSQALKPFPYYSAVSARNPHLGNSIYHALLLTVERRWSSGFVFLASYTKAKLISDSIITPINFGPGIELVGITGYQDPLYNRRLERSVDPTDISQRLVLSGIYAIPFRSTNRPLQLALGGWQLNTITTLQTGQPLNVTGASNNRATRPNSTGNSAKLDNPTAQMWFDTTQFINPPLYTLGTVGRTLPDVRAPGLFNMDLSLIKDTSITERVRLQFRAEAFNWINRTNLGLPNTSFIAGPDGRNTNGAFATITSARDSRIGQLALKLIF